MFREDWDNIEKITGYKPITEFYPSFSSADQLGDEAIQLLFEVLFTTLSKDWKTNYKVITELAMVLNWKCWAWAERNEKRGRLYEKLFYQVQDWVYKRPSGEELSYYIRTTD